MEDVTPERWLPVVGWEDYYEVSDLGRVRRLRSRLSKNGPRILKPYPPCRSHRHWTVRLCRDSRTQTYSVHILVARAFLGPCPDGHEVCHGPAGSSDNRLANLSYGTRAKNNGPDKHRDGTLVIGVQQSAAKLNDEIVRECRARAAAGESKAALAREFGVSSTLILYVVRGDRWRHVA